MMTDEAVNKEFKKHIQKITLKNILLISGFAVVAMSYYMYSDLVIRDSIQAFYVRFIPVTIAFILFPFHFFTRDRSSLNTFKINVYNILLSSGIVMMYSICLIHLHTDALAPSVTGAVLIIFIVSLEVKSSTKTTLLIYFLPLLAFSLSLIFFYKPSSEEFTIMADIYPINLAGFAINRIQYKLRYKAFKSGYLLEQEKHKTEELYKQTLSINRDLQLKTEEVIAHKEEIEEKNQKLQESNATKDKFLAIISHDLMGPFNILLGFSDVLKESFEANEDIEEQKQYVDYIHQNINKTYKLLENLLIWSRSQKDGMEFNLEKTNLFLMSKETIDLLKQPAQTKLIQIENKISSEINIEADQNMLATILRNLISNAIKFTPKEGKVVLDAKIVNGENQDKIIEISVQDSGVGISPEIQSKLFSISEGISTKGTEKEEGTGLGLILCKEFVEKHGGEIYVESDPGKGSTFIFTLPQLN